MTGLVVLSALAGISLAAFAETTTTTTSQVNTAEAPASAQTALPSSSSTATVQAPSESKFTAFLEVRPTYSRITGKMDTEDTIEVGYQFSKNVKLSYAQFLRTNLVDSFTSDNKGVNLRGDGGFLRMRVNNFYVSGDKKTKLSYQGRINTPTDDSMSGTGMIGSLYNGFAVSQDIGNLTLSLWEVPIFWAYSKSGSGTAANPIYQNRAMIVADWQITPSLLLSVPLIFDAQRNRQFAPSALSDRWQYNLWAWPELDYTINTVHTVGIAFRSANFMASDGSDSNIDGALNKGVFQAVWNVTL